MAEKPHDDFAAAIDAMNAAHTKGRGRKAPVYRWLRKHHDRLTAAFAENAPAWDALANYLGSIGVVNGDGSLPAGQGVRTAWRRVVADMAKRRVTTPTPAAPAGPVPPLVRAVTAPPPAQPVQSLDEPDTEPPRRFRFRNATPRNYRKDDE